MTTTSPSWRVVLQIDTASRKECLRYSDLPLVDPAHICLWSPPGDAAGEAQASRLFDRLRSALARLVPSASGNPSPCNGPRSAHCMARLEPRCHSVLVAACGGQTTLHSHQSFLDDWIARRNSRVLPVLPNGVNPGTLFPPPHDTAIALFHGGRVEVLAPDVLTAAGIADDEFRLFISYVQNDTKDFVDLLHDQFVHEGWRVYVDRFRGTPGRQFPYQIAEELMGMGCVLLVESTGVPNSQWTQAEIAFALQYRLGLVAAHLDGAPMEPTIPSRYRRTLSASPGLADVSDVVEFVRRHYLFQRLRRANFLTTLWRGALALHGVSATLEPAEVWTNPVPRKGNAAVVLARRATDLSDLRRLATSRAVYRRFALGPADLHPPSHREDVAWLASRLHLLLAREDEANDLAEDMANGRC